MIAFGMTNAEAALPSPPQRSRDQVPSGCDLPPARRQQPDRSRSHLLRSDERQPRAEPTEATDVDFQLYARVLWRFKLLVLLRADCSRSSLATLSLAAISADGTHVSADRTGGRASTRVLITQQRLPERPPARAGSVRSTPRLRRRPVGIPLADPNRLKHPHPAVRRTGDERHRTPADASARGPTEGPDPGHAGRRAVTGRYLATANRIHGDRGNTARVEMKLATRSANGSFSPYMTQQQRVNKVPARDRVPPGTGGCGLCAAFDLPAPLQDDAARDLLRRDVRDSRAGLPAREHAAACAARRAGGRARRQRTTPNGLGT